MSTWHILGAIAPAVLCWAALEREAITRRARGSLDRARRERIREEWQSWR
jgi:hypothetical protein